jgi:hypothetical protein
VPGIGGGDRVRALGNALAGQEGHASITRQPIRIELKRFGQFPVEVDQPRSGEPRRIDASEEPLRQARVTVVER